MAAAPRPGVPPAAASTRGAKRSVLGSAVRAKILFALSTDREQLAEPGDALGAAEQQKAGLVQTRSESVGMTRFCSA